MVGTRSLSSGARSRDPVALPALRRLRQEAADDHDRDRDDDQNPPHLDGDGCDAECGCDTCQEFFFSQDDGEDCENNREQAQRDGGC
jgi:hypothetical protein